MSGEIIAFAIVFVVGVLAGVQLEKANAKERRAKWRRRKGPGEQKHWREQYREIAYQPRGEDAPDAADQLRTVMKAEFKPQRLLNKSEARLFRAVDKQVLEARPGWQVMAQVSLGEILKCEDKAAYACINSKRVDLLIVDDECRPLHAIEYQGGGHHQGTAAARDAVKKEALRRAGIGYVEVVAGEMSPPELRQLIERLVQRVAA
jgi:hypothetical protein